jgi:hypothetical protein
MGGVAGTIGRDDHAGKQQQLISVYSKTLIGDRFIIILMNRTIQWLTNPPSST